MSFKQGYLHTHIIEKVERDKMSDNRKHSDEEERKVAVVGGEQEG